MSAYLLDTNTVSYFLCDHSQALKAKLLATAPSALAISVVTAAELQFGLLKLGSSQRGTALSARLNKLLGVIETLALPADAAWHCANTRSHLEAQRTPIGGNGLWIAAHALAADLTLVTPNLREFERVPGIEGGELGVNLNPNKPFRTVFKRCRHHPHPSHPVPISRCPPCAKPNRLLQPKHSWRASKPAQTTCRARQPPCIPRGQLLCACPHGLGSTVSHVHQRPRTT